MSFDEQMMERCIFLAQLGQVKVAPNPMVGCVITKGEQMLAESYHKCYGEPHAEPNAINQVLDKSQLRDCTLYVNLEPCAHYGKTPPCVNTIIENRFKRVVIGCRDSYVEVDGKGISMLKSAGIEVTVGVLEDSSRKINKRFFTYHKRKRPYIILKWAESIDNYIGNIQVPNQQISNSISRQRTHLWRSQEQAILIGANTAIVDNPTLTTRFVEGKNPMRFVIDPQLRIPHTHHLCMDEFDTVFFTNQLSHPLLSKQKKFVLLSSGNFMDQILNYLYESNIQSIIVEGGAYTIQQFINHGYWDEARVFTSSITLGKGVVSPTLRQHQLMNTEYIQDGNQTDQLNIYVNPITVF